MAKKFLSVMLLAVGIIFVSQNFVSAADVYAYSEGGIEYYVTGSRTLNLLVGAFGSFVKGVSGGKVVKKFLFCFLSGSVQWQMGLSNSRLDGRNGSLICD